MRSYLAGALALITCPCHLVLVLPLLLTLSAGTALHAFLVQHTTWLYVISGILFVISLVLAVYWWPVQAGEEACCLPASETSDQEEQPVALNRLPLKVEDM